MKFKSKQAITMALAAIMLAGCTKDSKTTDSPAATMSTSNMKDALLVSANQVNCGNGTLPAPSGGTLSYGPGTILAVNQPAGEAPIPSSIVFGPVVGGGIYPNYQKYILTLQGDGNLVLYLNVPFGHPTTSLWDSRTATGGANTNINNYLILQGDGNLVLKDRLTTGGLAQYWAAQDVLACSPAPTPRLYFQSDGNIVEEFPATNGKYGFLGNTGTGGGGNKSNHPGSF